MDKETRYYHKNSDLVAYKKIEDSNGYWRVYTFNEQGRRITYEDSNGYSCEYTYDENGNELTYEDSKGYSCERTYDENGNELTYEDSRGYWFKTTYDKYGREDTYENSQGDYRIKGSEVTKEEFERFFKLRPCVGKKVVVDGIEYTLN